MDDLPYSQRSIRIQQAAPFGLLLDFARRSDYQTRRLEPGVLDFTFGDPHEMPLPAYVDALREAAVPKDELWFAYKYSELPAQEAAAASLRKVVDLPWQAERIRMTSGGFAAITLAMKAVADPGDEVVYSLPPWFLYEGLALEAGLVPVKVSVDLATFDLDLEAIERAITPRTRLVIVNTPNNPSGRIYPPETLEALARLLETASQRFGRRIYLISDEPYNRIVFDGATFHSPAQFYPWTLLCYSYGKTLLSPGQRVGYLALPPSMPDAERLLEAVETVQIAAGWLFPNAVLQYAVPRLEELSLDLEHLQAKRDRMVGALREMGYTVASPEGTFYLFPTSPLADDQAFVDVLAQADVLVMPGRLFETPGYFRICLTATMDTIEASLPRFAAALEGLRGVGSS
jgi:aspartate aminotransferase